MWGGGAGRCGAGVLDGAGARRECRPRTARARHVWYGCWKAWGGDAGAGWRDVCWECGCRIVRRGKGGKGDPAPACNFFRICESLGPSVSVFSSIRAHNPRWVFRKHPQGLTYPEKIALQARKTSGMHAPWPALQTRERTGGLNSGEGVRGVMASCGGNQKAPRRALRS